MLKLDSSLLTLEQTHYLLVTSLAYFAYRRNLRRHCWANAARSAPCAVRGSELQTFELSGPELTFNRII